MTDPSPVEPPPPGATAPWIPKVGLVLKHRYLKQSIEIVGSMEIAGLPTFWSVRLYDSYGDPKPWFILETALMEQYEVKEQ